MAGTIQSRWVVTSSEEKDWPHRKFRHRPSDKQDLRVPLKGWDKPNSKVGPLYPDFKHQVTKDSLWIHGWYNPSWFGEEIRIRGLALSTEAPSGGAELSKVIHGQGTALVALPQSQARDVVVHDEGSVLVALLRSCTKNKDLSRGTRIHDDILKRGLLDKCSDALVTMYAKCGSLAKAKALLDMHKSRDVISWTALIAGYARERQSQDALDCYERMQVEGIPPDAVTYASILKACGNTGAADKGEQIH
eukprot:c25258_g10_i1 orf=28-771(+)